jgi:DNA-binding XRE family transcriptional regulator
MSRHVLLLSDRPAFETRFRGPLERAGLRVATLAPEAAADTLREHVGVVIDAGCEAFDEDELLAHVGLARALRIPCAVVLEADERFADVEELLEDLCPGLVLLPDTSVERVAQLFARRLDRERARRFEYLAVSPRPSELLAVFADGSAACLPRPLTGDDDGSDVASIGLGSGAEKASVTLASGRVLELRAAQGAAPASVRPSAPPTNGSSTSVLPIDGVRLGQRLRELRVAAGLTQAELARRTGIHRPNIARVEAGRHTPSLETLARLATAIGVPTTSVLAED